MLAISGATYAQITDDENVNNGCTGAFNETLPLDVPNPAQLQTLGDEDWVKVELPPQGGVLTVYIDPVLNASFRIEVYNTCGGAALVTQFDTPPLSDSTGVAALVCGGTHFIRVKREAGTAPAPINYVLHATYDATTDGFECNNSFAEAALVPVNTTLQGTLYGMNIGFPLPPEFYGEYDQWYDRDVYKVAPGQCGTLHVSASGGPQTGKLTLTAYNSSFTKIHHHTAAVQPGQPVSMDVLVTGDTTYIVVAELGMYTVGNPVLANVPYTLTFNFDTSDECECNNTLATSCPIEVDTPLELKLYGTNITFEPDEDVDHFIFDVDCDTLRAIVTDVPANQRVKLTLYDPNLTQNGSPVTASTPGADVTLQRVGLPEGQYILQVSENSNTMSADAYTLMVQCSVNDVSTGPERSAQQRMSIAPNPATGFVTIKFGGQADIRHLTLLDATGRLVLSQPIANNSGPVSMDLSGHENGLYLVQVLFSDGTRAVQRVVKE